MEDWEEEQKKDIEKFKAQLFDLIPFLESKKFKIFKEENASYFFSGWTIGLKNDEDIYILIYCIYDEPEEWTVYLGQCKCDEKDMDDNGDFLKGYLRELDAVLSYLKKSIKDDLDKNEYRNCFIGNYDAIMNVLKDSNAVKNIEKIQACGNEGISYYK